MKGLYRLEWKYGKYAIPNLMLIVVIGMFTVYVAELMFPQVGLSAFLSFDRDMVFSGQVWRLISFTVLPPASSIWFILLSLYFYYMIGSALERAWGSFKFNVYYFCGILGTILAGLITGYTGNQFLNLSLFFAFAALYPETQILLFFVLPIKIKYLAYVDAAYFLYLFIMGGWSTKAAILAALINFFLFFGKDFFGTVKTKASTWRSRQNFKKSMRK